MKRKTWISFLIGLLICLISVLFVGCDEETNSNNGITFNTLTVEETTVYGTVANSVESFSFIDEINANGKTKFVVSLDIYGLEQIPTKTLPLEVGNNTVYITEMLDDEPINVFTVTLRRRPMYTVNFNTSGGTRVESQMVEEGFFASKPDETITRIGYTFTDWNYDFTTPITGDMTINAGWMGNSDTPYKVEYYFQNLENDGYTLQEEQTEYFTGTTGTIAIADIKEFTHFTPERESVTSIINGDGKSVLKVYYTRNKYTVTFDGNGGTLVGVFGGDRISRTVKYGGTALAPTFVLTGYTLNGWDKSFTNVSENVTSKAQWKINQYTLTIVYGNGQDNKLITQDYNTEIETIVSPYKESWEFIGWDTQLPTIMPAENRTITAKWKSVCIRSGNTITGLSDYGKQNCTKLEIPSSIDGVKITSISNSAFENCSNLIKVTIPDSVTRIGWSAFRECSGLTEITLPFLGERNDVANANGYSGHLGYIFGASDYFDKHEHVPISLKKVTITCATNICRFAFEDCSGLTSITIPSSVTSIGHSAFSGCSGLISITIPESVTSIGSYAFDGCSGLASVTFSDTSTWYRTNDPTNWENKTGGTITDVTSSSTNATYFKSTYDYYYWYKL